MVLIQLCYFHRHKSVRWGSAPACLSDTLKVLLTNVHHFLSLKTCDKHQERIIASNTSSSFQISTSRAILSFPQKWHGLPAGRNASGGMHTTMLFLECCLFSWTTQIWVSQVQLQQCRWTSFTMAGLFPNLPMENRLLSTTLSDVGHLWMWHPPAWLEAGSRPVVSKAASRSFLLIVLKRKAIKLGADTDSYPVWIGQRGGA